MTSVAPLENAAEYTTTRAHFPCIAAIDVGTNSCRILVASINLINLHRNYFKLRNTNEKQMRIIDSYSRIVGLGEGLKQTGVLSLGAIERTLEALTVCREKLSVHRVERMRAVATEACRQAQNADELVERALRETGIRLEIIEPEEEAQLVLKGCMKVMSDQYPYGIMLDIGGGSTELIWLRIHQHKVTKKLTMSILDSTSLPYGVVTLRDTCEHGDHDEKIFQMAQEDIYARTQAFMAKNKIFAHMKKNEVQIVSSSGSVTTLASLVLGLSKYDRKLVDGQDFRTEDLRREGTRLINRYLMRAGDQLIPEDDSIIQEFLGQRMADMSMTPFLRPTDPLMSSRMGLLASGSVILDALLEILAPDVLRIADRGVREGLLHQLTESYHDISNAPQSSSVPYTALKWS